jgi:hypothetical protein
VKIKKPKPFGLSFCIFKKLAFPRGFEPLYPP